MRRRGCLLGCGGGLFAIIVICGLLYFVGLPRFQDSLRDGVADALSTQVARQIDTQIEGRSLQPGEYRISLSKLQQEISDSNSDDQISGVAIRGDGDAIVFQIKTNGQTLEYRGVPAVVDGRLQMTDMTSTSGALDFFLPPDKLGQAIDRGVNTYIQGQGKSLETVRVEGSELVFDVGN